MEVLLFIIPVSTPLPNKSEPRKLYAYFPDGTWALFHVIKTVMLRHQNDVFYGVAKTSCAQWVDVTTKHHIFWRSNTKVDYRLYIFNSTVFLVIHRFDGNEFAADLERSVQIRKRQSKEPKQIRYIHYTTWAVSLRVSVRNYKQHSKQMSKWPT